MEKRIREKCVLWPDTKPLKDLTGSTFFHITYLYPVYKAYARWVWLAECECGTEFLTFANQSRSCGCYRSDKRIVLEPLEKANSNGEFDRATICFNKPFKCKYYYACQDERLSLGVPVSARYKPGCYTKDLDELRICGD